MVDTMVIVALLDHHSESVAGVEVDLESLLFISHVIN